MESPDVRHAVAHLVTTLVVHEARSHRLPERIRAHASLCFMALIPHRVMRSRLQAAYAGYTPERALEQLQRIQHLRMRLNGGEPVAGCR